MEATANIWSWSPIILVPTCTHSFFFVDYQNDAIEKLHYYNLHLIFQILAYGCVFMSLHASGSEWERWGKNRRVRHEWIGKFVAPIANFFKFVTNGKKSTHGNRKVNKTALGETQRAWEKEMDHEKKIASTTCLTFNWSNLLLTY